MTWCDLHTGFGCSPVCVRRRPGTHLGGHGGGRDAGIQPLGPSGQPSTGRRPPAAALRRFEPRTQSCGTEGYGSQPKDRDDDDRTITITTRTTTTTARWARRDRARADTSGPSGALTKQVTVDGHAYTTDPGGLTVTPGDVVNVTISWSAWAPRCTVQVTDCLYVGRPPTLGGANLGASFDKADAVSFTAPFTTSFTVLGRWEGETVCDRGKASGALGEWGGTVESNQFCFFVEPPAVVAETPWPALFVILPMVAGAAAIGDHPPPARRPRRDTQAWCGLFVAFGVHGGRSPQRASAALIRLLARARVPAQPVNVGVITIVAAGPEQESVLGSYVTLTLPPPVLGPRY